jgi:hypothetical protein
LKTFLKGLSAVVLSGFALNFANITAATAQVASLMNVLENSIATQAEMDGDTTVSGLQVLPSDLATAVKNFGKTAVTTGSSILTGGGSTLTWGLEAFAGVPELNLESGLSDCGLFSSTGCVYVSPTTGDLTTWTAGPPNVTLSPTGGVTSGSSLFCGSAVNGAGSAQICTGSAVGTAEGIGSDWCATAFSAYTTCWDNPPTVGENGSIGLPDISVTFTINGTPQTSTYSETITNLGNATSTCPTGYAYYMPSLTTNCATASKIKISLSSNILPPSYSPVDWTAAERNAVAAGTDGGLSLSDLTTTDIQKMASGLWTTAAAESGYLGPPLNAGELPISSEAADIALSGAIDTQNGYVPTGADAIDGVGTITNAGTGSQAGGISIATPETLVGVGNAAAAGSLVSPDSAYAQVGGVAAADAAALQAAGISVGSGTTTGEGGDGAATPQDYFCGAASEVACTIDFQNTTNPATDPTATLTVPTPDDLFSPLFNLFPSLTNWSVPAHSDTCPQPSLTVLGRTYQVTSGCQLLQQNASDVASGVDVAWVLSALLIVLGA